MTKISVDIPDEIYAGAGAARAAFNAALPIMRDAKGEPTGQPNPDAFATDEAYAADRILKVFQSWADQYGLSTAAQTKAKAEFIAKLPADKRAAVDLAVSAELAKAGAVAAPAILT